MYVTLAEGLSRVGIASLRLDFRGSGDSEGPFSEMSFNGEVSDALLALDYLSKHSFIDPEKIGIFGRSFGGAIAIMAAEEFKKIKSIALWASVFDVEQWERQWEMIQTGQVDEEERHELMRINGQLPSMNFFKEMFAMNLEDDLANLQATPLLHIHGEKDPVVGIEHADKYVELRKNATAESKFIRLPHSDHDFTHPEEKLLAINETCHWFSKTL